MAFEVKDHFLMDLYSVFKRNAVGWFDADGVSERGENLLVEQLTLINGDKVLIYFNQGPEEIIYFRNQKAV